jgi:transcription elongation GreA/GreB family factor
MCDVSREGWESMQSNLALLKKRERTLRRGRSRARVPQTVGRGEITPSEDSDASRDLELIDERIESLKKKLTAVKIVEPPVGTKRLSIGHIVTIQRSDATGNKIGKPERYFVGGFEEMDPQTTPPTLSYNAPILYQLMGLGVDSKREPFEIILGGKSIFIELLKIELPQQKRANLKIAS